MGVIVMILLVIALIVSLIGGIWFLYVSFNESIPWGLACLLVPFASLFFLAMHWRDASKPFGVSLLGTLIMLLARSMMPMAASGGGSTTVSWAVANPAPSFTLRDLDGKQVSLSDFKGKVVILDFWATWCPPCVKEVPHFVALYEQYKDQGFVMVGISLDSKGVSVVESFAQKYGVDYPILMADAQVQAAYGGIKSIPTTFVIDAEGNLKRKYIGYRDKAVFEADIKTLLTDAKLEEKPMRVASPQRRETTSAISAAQPYPIDDQDEIVPALSRPEELTSIESEESDTPMHGQEKK